MTSGQPGTPPVKPDPSDSTTALIQNHLHTFFSSMVDAHGPETPGCFRSISGQPHPLGNIGLVGPTVESGVITEFARPLADDSFPSAVVLMGGDDHAQAAPLTTLGFFRAESMCLMSVTPTQLTPTTLADGYRLLEVGPDDDTRWCEAFAQGYEIPLELAEKFSPSAFAKRIGNGRYFAAEKDGTFAAVSLYANLGGVPGIYSVATMPAHRGKGLGGHVTAEALRMAWKDGSAGGVLQSSQVGEPVYRRIGFQSHGHMALYVRIPGSGAG